jgi:hypothetical protein
MPSFSPIDGPRPGIGTGSIVGGAMMMAGSGILMLVATLGRDTLGLDERDAKAFGISSGVIGMLGGMMVVVGSLDSQRYQSWVARNQLEPPTPGIGMLVAGSVLTSGGAVAAAFAVERNRAFQTPDLGDKLIVGFSGATAAVGALLLLSGIISRSRFAGWEGAGYPKLGFHASRSGAGVSVGGRF